MYALPPTVPIPAICAPLGKVSRHGPFLHEEYEQAVGGSVGTRTLSLIINLFPGPGGGDGRGPNPATTSQAATAQFQSPTAASSAIGGDGVDTEEGLETEEDDADDDNDNSGTYGYQSPPVRESTYVCVISL